MVALAASPSAADAACTLTLIVTPCIEVSVPSSHAWGSLAPGTQTSTEQHVVVSSNQAWGLRASVDRAGAKMAEWNGSSYVASGRTLTSALEFARTSIDGAPQAPSWTTFSTTDQTVVTGRPHTGCVLNLLCGTDDIGVTYRQAVSYADRRVSPNSYRIRVTYTATHGW